MSGKCEHTYILEAAEWDDSGGFVLSCTKCSDLWITNCHDWDELFAELGFDPDEGFEDED